MGLWLREKTHLKKIKKNRSLPSFPGRPSRSSGFDCFCTLAGLSPYLDRFSHRIDRMPDQPADPVRV